MLRHRERVGDKVVVIAEQPLEVLEVRREDFVLQLCDLLGVGRAHKSAEDRLVSLGAVVLDGGEDVVDLVLVLCVSRHQPTLSRHVAQHCGGLCVGAAVHDEHRHICRGVTAEL